MKVKQVTMEAQATVLYAMLCSFIDHIMTFLSLFFQLCDLELAKWHPWPTTECTGLEQDHVICKVPSAGWLEGKDQWEEINKDTVGGREREKERRQARSHERMLGRKPKVSCTHRPGIKVVTKVPQWAISHVHLTHWSKGASASRPQQAGIPGSDHGMTTAPAFSVYSVSQVLVDSILSSKEKKLHSSPPALTKVSFFATITSSWTSAALSCVQSLSPMQWQLDSHITTWLPCALTGKKHLTDPLLTPYIFKSAGGLLAHFRPIWTRRQIIGLCPT